MKKTIGEPCFARAATQGDLETRSEEPDMNFLPMLIAALMAVKSGSDLKLEIGKIGDHGRALGVLQIHREVVADVNRIYGTTFRHEDALDPDLAATICEMYLTHYGAESATGKMPSPEVYARIWNGGPRGHLKEGTRGYWEKVRKHL